MWFLSYFAPKPPPGRRTDVLSIGFKWVANAGVPAMVEVYKKAPGDQEATYPDVAAGIYVGCQYDYFGSPEVFTGTDDAAVDPVYDPLQPSQGLLQAAAEVGLSNPRMLSLLQGYFRYTAGCLDQIYADQIGRQVIDGIVGAGKAVLVYPSGTGNSVQVQNMQAALSRAAEALVFADKRPLNAVVLQDLVAGAYPGVDIAAAFDNLATAVNAMPLCSEFALPSHPDGFLGPLMPARIGQPLNGQVFQQWLAGQCPAMTTFLQYRDRSGYQASGLMLEGVALPNYFYIALIAKLHASSGAWAGLELEGDVLYSKAGCAGRPSARYRPCS